MTTHHHTPVRPQEILAVFDRTDGGLRAQALCRALDIGNRPRHTEAMRAEPKRLAAATFSPKPNRGLFTMNRGDR